MAVIANNYPPSINHCFILAYLNNPVNSYLNKLSTSSLGSAPRRSSHNELLEFLDSFAGSLTPKTKNNPLKSQFKALFYSKKISLYWTGHKQTAPAKGDKGVSVRIDLPILLI